MQATLERLRQRREEQGDEGGFTLIELLIVIVILGILAAIVVFAVQNLTGQSTVAACQAQYKTVETAAEAYLAQTGNYPLTLAALQQTGVTGVDGSTVGPWIKDLPPQNVAGNTSPYTIGLDFANKQVQVATFTIHGATKADAAADLGGNCVDA